jgi:MTH538 TIR-like domain (DUF1863)
VPYRVFISHAYSDHGHLYDNLVARLNGRSFNWRDVSLPRQRRVEAALPDATIERNLRLQIRNCDVVLAIAKPIASRRRWMKYELALAKDMGKPIVALWRRHVDRRTSRFVLDLADETVDSWEIDNIIDAVERVVAKSGITVPPREVMGKGASGKSAGVTVEQVLASLQSVPGLPHVERISAVSSQPPVRSDGSKPMGLRYRWSP